MELLNTEKSYVQSLGNLMEFYVRPMQEAGNLPQEKLTIVFSNVESIWKLSQYLLSGLQQRIEREDINSHPLQKIGDVFLEVVSYSVIPHTFFF